MDQLDPLCGDGVAPNVVQVPNGVAASIAVVSPRTQDGVARVVGDPAILGAVGQPGARLLAAGLGLELPEERNSDVVHPLLHAVDVGHVRRVSAAATGTPLSDENTKTTGIKQ